MASSESSPNPNLYEKDRIDSNKSHPHPQSQLQPEHSRSNSIQDQSAIKTTNSGSSSSSASPLNLPELLPSSSSDRSSFSTMHSSTSSSRNSSNLIPPIQFTADQSSSSNSNAQTMDRLSAEQEKQSHYVSRRSPLGPRPEGSSSFEQSEEEIERAQLQAERDMYAHIHAHMQKPSPILADRNKSKNSIGGDERRRRAEGNGRYDTGIRNEVSEGGSRSVEAEIRRSNVAVVDSGLSDPTSQRDYQQEAQLQAAAKYASLASLSPPSILKDSLPRQEIGEEGRHLLSSSTDSNSSQLISPQEEVPRLSTSSAESSVNSDVATPEKYEREMWGRSDSTGKGEKLEEALERKMEETYPDPEPDTQDLQSLQAMMHQSSISSASFPTDSTTQQTRPAMASRLRSSDKSTSTSSIHTTIPSKPSSSKSQNSSTLVASPPSPPSTVSSSTSSAAQTPAASQDRDPMADIMKSSTDERTSQNNQIRSSSSMMDPTKPIGMSGSSSTQRRPPPSAPPIQDSSSFSSSSSSMPHSSPTASTASGPGGAAPTSPTTSAGLSLRASLASPDSWRSLLPEHDPYFADPDAEEGSRSTAGSVSGASGSGHGHNNSAEDRFRKNSRQNSSTSISNAIAGSSALGIASMNTPSATSLSAQLAQFGVGSYSGVGEPFPRCSSSASAAGSSNGILPSSNQNGTAYAYASSTSSSVGQDHMRRLSNTSQLSSFSLPGPTASNGLSSLGQDENWEEREKERMKRESWRSFLPEGDPAHPTSTNPNRRERDLYPPHRRTNTNSAVSVASSSPSLSFSDSPNSNNHHNSSPHWQQSQQQNSSPRLNRAGLYEDLSSNGHPSQGQVGNSNLSNLTSAEAARRHASFSAWESAQRDRDGFRGLIRRNGQEAINGNGMQPPSMMQRNLPRRTGSTASSTSFNSFNLPSEGMVHSHSQPPYIATSIPSYPTSTSTSHSTTQITSYRNLHQQLQNSNTNPNDLNRRLLTSAVMGDNDERELWPSSGTSLSSSSLSGDLREGDLGFEEAEGRKASGLRGDLEGWTVGREVDLGSMGLARAYDAPVSIVQEHLDPNSAVLLTTTTTTTTTTFTRVSQPPSQPQSPTSERSNPSSPPPTSMQARSYSNSGSNVAPSSPIAVPQPSTPNPLQQQNGERSDSPYLVSPLSPPSVPFLDHRQAPASTNLTIETTAERYVVNVRLPNFSLEHITLATKHHRTLHIVADNFHADGGHVERRVTFHNDALMRQVQAEFDGELLKVIVPRRITTSNQNTLTPIIQPNLSSINHLQHPQQQQQQPPNLQQQQRNEETIQNLERERFSRD